MSQVYNSIYTGNQIDSALGVIVESSISVSHLQVLVGVVSGSGGANKAVVLDTNRNFVNINSLSLNVLKAEYFDLLDRINDPTAAPIAGRKFLYFKNGLLWMKDSTGVVIQIKSGGKKEVIFTNQTQVIVNHQFGEQFPSVLVSIANKDVKADIEYTDVSNTTVGFNQPQSGRIICRIV